MKSAFRIETWPPPPKPAAVQPMPETEKQNLSWKRWLGLPLASAAFLPALYQWALVLYRLNLFWSDYKGQLGMNHADDFRNIYAMDACAVPVSLLAVTLLWRQRGRDRRLSLYILAANILGAGAFFVMHKTGVLVNYSEYIGR